MKKHLFLVITLLAMMPGTGNAAHFPPVMAELPDLPPPQISMENRSQVSF